MAFALTASACATVAENAEAPDTVLDALEPRDVGQSYNGWSQTGWADIDHNGKASTVSHTLNRTSGDATRGGGACLILPGSYTGSCSQDSTCQSAATARWGSSAWGYCYQGSCYDRPGSQSTFCVLNPNRTAGTLSKETDYSTLDGESAVWALSCMTKTAGPNTACGGTNTSLYMRYRHNGYIYGNPI